MLAKLAQCGGLTQFCPYADLCICPHREQVTPVFEIPSFIDSGGMKGWASLDNSTVIHPAFDSYGCRLVPVYRSVDYIT